MTANRFSSRILATALLLAGMAPATTGNAQTLVYKSVDDQGRVSFGDRPAADAALVEEIYLAPLVPRSAAAESDEHIERLAATTSRLREDRLAREERRAAAASARQQPQVFPEYPAYPPEFRSWGISRVYPGRGFLHYPRAPFRLHHSGGLLGHGDSRPPRIGDHRFPHSKHPGLVEPPRRLLRHAAP